MNGDERRDPRPKSEVDEGGDPACWLDEFPEMLEPAPNEDEDDSVADESG